MQTRKIAFDNLEFITEKNQRIINAGCIGITIPMSLRQIYALKCLLQDTFWDNYDPNTLEYDRFVKEADFYYQEILE